MFLSMLSSLALYCVGWEGFHTSLKPEETFIYLYDGRMVGMSEIGSRLCQVYGASNCCLLGQLDHTTIVEVYESLFWLQTSVQAF